MPDNCPICRTVLKEKRGGGSEHGYGCPRCGRFLMSDCTDELLQARIQRGSEEGKDEEEQRAVISHSIRKMQKKDEKGWPPIDNQLIEAILKNPLPNVAEQANNLITWLAENTSQGEHHSVQARTHQSIIGAKTPRGISVILKHLFDEGLLDGDYSQTSGGPQAIASLSFSGWQYYEQLKRGAVDSRKAFMAMKYGDTELDGIVANCFEPAVAATGFKLYRLDENPKAGLIDDRLRVEIRNSRFLISDLTHENSGAYWEAGYAEGLGKPVIYTCKKDVFNKTHFDTNHHLTVIWDATNLQEAIGKLKATIRATLPDEAKLSDD